MAQASAGRAPDQVGFTPVTHAAAQAVEREVSELVAKGQVQIFAYPAVALKLGTLLRRDNVGIAEVSRVISADPALAGAVLRLANSATYNRGSTGATTLTDAVGRVGLKAVHQIALAAGLGQEVCQTGPLQELRLLCWRWAVSSAILCQQLAARREVEAGVAFLGGLLHTFGKAVAVSAMEQVLKARPRALSLPQSEWLAIVEARHRQLGILVARRWNLPAVVRAALLDSAVESDDLPTRGLVELCQLADRVIREVESKPSVGASDLERVPGFFDYEEIELVATLVPRLPSAIHALLEAPPPPAARTAAKAEAPVSVVEKPPSLLGGSVRELDLSVVQFTAKRRIEYRGVQAAEDALVLSGAQPMQTNNIVRLELAQSAGPFCPWVRVASCEPGQGGYSIVVVPFALGREDRLRWDQVVRGGG
ncbi:MAG: HDOD domain-containing protein [Polyangiaceae bacterium]|nr:HDOD domain-containing protein [Polyangiaceae bacterium]